MLRFKFVGFFCSKQFCIITFFRISYNSTEKWNLDIDFFQVLTYTVTFLILV